MPMGGCQGTSEQPLLDVLLQHHVLAKPAKGEYRRNLPHLQVEDKPIFLTFCTFQRWSLPEAVRSWFSAIACMNME